jgi:branched-chain amino acid transport system ATP-binding protein
MTVMENLELGAYSQASATANRARLQEVIALFPVLSSRRNQMAGHLSGGERQMCGIARAMMSNPKLLMLDEPSVGLSPAMVERVFETVASLARSSNMTVVIVEQNVSEVLEIADRAYVLDHGSVVRSGDARTLRDDREIQETYMGL